MEEVISSKSVVEHYGGLNTRELIQSTLNLQPEGSCCVSIAMSNRATTPRVIEIKGEHASKCLEFGHSTEVSRRPFPSAVVSPRTVMSIRTSTAEYVLCIVSTNSIILLTICNGYTL